AISQLLLATIPNTNIQAEEKDYLPIARQNDRTFRNVVENLVRLRNRQLALTPDKYQDTLRANWDQRYQQAVQRDPVAAYIYDAVDLLRQLEISLTEEIVRSTALLILGNQFWQLRQRYRVKHALNYLIDAEQILSPRDGQIEARDKTIEPQQYLPKLAAQVLKLTEENLDLFSLYNLAFNLYQYQYYKAALACADKLISYLPQSPQTSFVLLLRGTVLWNLKYYERSLKSFDQALELNSDYYEPWYNRGNVLSDLGRYEEALYSYDQALELNSNYYEAWNNRGNVLSDLGRYEEALYSYDQALKLKPDKVQVWNNRGNVLINLERYEEALYSYDQALELNSNYYAAWNNRSNVLFILERYEEALDSFNQALKLKPNKAQVWNNRGIVLGILERYEDALDSFDQAIKLKPDDDQAWYLKAMAYSLQNNVDLAVKDLAQAIKLNSKYKEMAKNDSNFDNIRNEPRFKSLIDD
ncbi:MAG: tetratricopeptide repeat protein, partial [Cyanobacteria bacterium P01_A01_bin.83]